MDAYGIRCIVSGRTLLIGDRLNFPWALCQNRPAGEPVFTIGQVTIPCDWTPDDYVLLEPQAYLNKAYDEENTDKQQATFAKAANRNTAYMHMDVSM